jgi:hypothetical protein
MRRLFMTAAAAMALVGGATTANAAAVVSAPVGPTPASVSAPGTFIIGSNLSAGPGMFDDTFVFTLGSASALFNGQVSSMQGPIAGTQNINFTTLTVDGATVFTQTSDDPSTETWSILSPVLLSAGDHTIVLAGNLAGTNGSYVGNFNIQAVPEAGTWTMMLLGFGAMGFAIRRRRNPVFAQIA